MKHQFETAKHQQLIGWFNKNFVKTSIIDPALSAIIHKAYNKRTNADYSFQFDISKEEITVMFEEMKKLIEDIKQMLN